VLVDITCHVCSRAFASGGIVVVLASRRSGCWINSGNNTIVCRCTSIGRAIEVVSDTTTDAQGASNVAAHGARE
jgi:hypothetical protein